MTKQSGNLWSAETLLRFGSLRNSGRLVSLARLVISTLDPKRCRISTLPGLILISVATSASAQDKVTYADHVRTIFESKCFSCHNTDKKKGGLDLSTFTSTMEGGSGGAVFEAGNASGSRLIQSITKQAEPFMPPKGEPIPKDQIAMLEKWVEGGMLETKSSVAAKPKKVMVDLVVSDALGKPEGPPPMPEHLLLEPITQSARATTVWSIAASTWAPLLAVSGQHQILLYHSDTLELNGIIPYPTGIPHDLHFSENGKLLLAAGGRGGKSGKVHVFDIKSGRQVMDLGAEFDAVLGADISADQAFVALGGPNKKVKAFSTSDGEVFKEINKHTEWVTAVDYSPDGVLLATADRNGNVFVWETFTGNEFYKLGGHAKKVTGLSWRADSNVLASVGEDGQVKLWAMNNGNQAKAWGAHGGVLSVDFAKDGRLITGGRDRKAVIWAGDGKALVTLQGFTDIVTEVEFSHNDERVFVSDWNGVIKAFDAKDGKELGTIDANPPTIETRLATLETRTTELAQQYPRAATQFHRTLKPFEEAAAALSKLKSRLDEDNKKHQQLTSNRDALNKANAEAQATLQLASSELKGIDQEAAALKRTIESSHAEQQRLQGLKERMSQCQATKAALESALAALDPTSDDVNLAKAREQSTAALASIHRAIETLTPEVADMNEKLATQKSTIETTQPLLDEKNKALAKRQEDLKKKQEQAANANAALNKNVDATKQTRMLVDQRTKDLPARQAAFDTAQKAHVESRQQADTLLNALTSSKKTLQHWQAARFNVRVIAQRRQLEDQQTELLGLQDMIAQLDTAHQEALNKANSGEGTDSNANPQHLEELANERAENQSKAEALAVSVEELKIQVDQGHQKYLKMTQSR